MSVRAIASQAGVSTIGIYSHFQGKQGILDALYIEGFDYVRAVLVAACGVSDAKEAVLAGIRGYLDVASQHEATYRLIFGEVDLNYSPGEDARDAGMDAFAVLVQLGSRLLPQDSSKAEQQAVALRIWAVVHGYVSLQHHAVKDLVEIDSWAEQALAALHVVIDDVLARGV